MKLKQLGLGICLLMASEILHAEMPEYCSLITLAGYVPNTIAVLDCDGGPVCGRYGGTFSIRGYPAASLGRRTRVGDGEFCLYPTGRVAAVSYGFYGLYPPADRVVEPPQ